MQASMITIALIPRLHDILSFRNIHENNDAKIGSIYKYMYMLISLHFNLTQEITE